MVAVSKEGERLIDQWSAAEKELGFAKSRFDSAERGVNEAKQALARWLLPDDAQPGEKIAIWYGNGSLIQIEVAAAGPHSITVRSKGKHARENGQVA